MKRVLPTLLAGAVLAVIAVSLAPNPRMGVQPDGSIIVPTGQTITPAGTHIEVADRPLGMAVSPGGDQLAVVTGSNFAGRRRPPDRPGQDSIRQSIPIGDSFVGVTFSHDMGHLYVGGGRDNNVKFFLRREDGTYVDDGVVPIPGSAPSGLSLSPDGEWLYVALNTRHSLAILTTQSRAVKEVPVGAYPYTTVVTRGRREGLRQQLGRPPAEPGDATEPGIPWWSIQRPECRPTARCRWSTRSRSAWSSRSRSGCIPAPCC